MKSRVNKIIKKCLNKFIIIICSLCSCFSLLFINPVTVHAEVVKELVPIVIDGVTYLVEDFSQTANGFITHVVVNGEKYVATTAALSNITHNHNWAKTAITGLVTMASFGIIATVGNIDKDINSTKNIKTLIDHYNNGSWSEDDSNLYKYYFGRDLEYDSSSNLYSLEDYINKVNNQVESSYRNYYDTKDSEDNYKLGDTTYYTVKQGDKFYNTYNNTYETINNYDYDIYNNYYNYYTTENHYHVTNNYNNTYIFNTGGNYDYSLYYKLPNGSNSFNLDEDDILGIRTDFNVSNYEINYNDDSVLGIYHLNGNAISSVNSSYEPFYNSTDYFPYSSTNYVDSTVGFDLGYMSAKKKIFRLIDDNIKNVRFKLYVSDSNTSHTTTKLTFNHRGDYVIIPTNSFVSIEFNGNSIYSDDLEIYVNGVLSDINHIEPYTLSYFELYSYDDLFDLSTINTPFTKNFTVSYSGSPYNARVTVNSIGDYYLVKYSNYNMYYFYTNGTYYDNFFNESTNFTNSQNGYAEVSHWGINGLKNKYYTLDDFDDYFELSFNNGQFYILDELRLGSTTLTNHGISYLPYSDSTYYTLPLTETNNKLLIQSDIPVNDFQFGGIRPSEFNSHVGDVYINLLNDKINSIQQFNGLDWISVDGAIYNETLGKWVNAIGFSIYTNNWEYTDLSPNEVRDINSLAVWLSSAFNGLTTSLSSLFNDLKQFIDEKVQYVITFFSGGEVVTDDDSELIEDIKGDDDIDTDDITDYTDDMKQAFNDFPIPSLEEDIIGDDIDDIKEISDTVIGGLFDTLENNGLSYIWITLGIILIIRMII